MKHISGNDDTFILPFSFYFHAVHSLFKLFGHRWLLKNQICKKCQNRCVVEMHDIQLTYGILWNSKCYRDVMKKDPR